MRKGLVFKQLNISTKKIEATGVTISTTGNNEICIIAAYFPGTRRGSEWSQFRHEIRSLVTQNSPYFVIGDLNARHRSWNCVKNNKAGTILCQEASHSGFNINFPDSPTFIPAGRGSPSTLDIVLSNNLVNMSKPIVHNELSSDHLPVTFEISLSADPAANTATVRCYARADWLAFQRLINTKLCPNDPMFSNIRDENGVNTALNFFKDALLDAESFAVPLITPVETRYTLVLRRRPNCLLKVSRLLTTIKLLVIGTLLKLLSVLSNRSTFLRLWPITPG